MKKIRTRLEVEKLEAVLSGRISSPDQERRLALVIDEQNHYGFLAMSGYQILEQLQTHGLTVHDPVGQEWSGERYSILDRQISGHSLYDASRGVSAPSRQISVVEYLQRLQNSLRSAYEHILRDSKHVDIIVFDRERAMPGERGKVVASVKEPREWRGKGEDYRGIFGDGRVLDQGAIAQPGQTIPPAAFVRKLPYEQGVDNRFEQMILELYRDMPAHL